MSKKDSNLSRKIGYRDSRRAAPRRYIDRFTGPGADYRLGTVHDVADQLNKETIFINRFQVLLRGDFFRLRSSSFAIILSFSID